MDTTKEDILVGSLLIALGLLIVLERWGIIPRVLLQDIWPAVLIISGLLFLYRYFSKNPM